MGRPSLDRGSDLQPPVTLGKHVWFANTDPANKWESHEARTRCAEPCCFRGFPDRCWPTGMCVCWWNLLFLVSSILFFGWQKIIPATVVLSQGHSLPTPVAPSHWQMEAFQLHPKPVNLWESWPVKSEDDRRWPAPYTNSWVLTRWLHLFFITSIHVYPHYRLRHNQQGQPSCLALPSRGTWWSHPGAWKWGANKIQLQFGTIWSSSPCNNLGFHVKSWFVRCIPSIKQGSMATQLRPTSINRAH